MFFGQKINPKKQYKITDQGSPGDVLNLTNVALDPSSYQAELYIKYNTVQKGEKIILVTELSREDRVKSAAINVFLNVMQEPSIIAKKGAVHVIGFWDEASESAKKKIIEQVEAQIEQERTKNKTQEKRKIQQDVQEQDEEHQLDGERNYALEDYSDHSQSLSKEEQAAINMQRDQRVSILLHKNKQQEKVQKNQEAKSKEKAELDQDMKDYHQISRIVQQDAKQFISLRRSKRTQKNCEKSELKSAKNAKKQKQRQRQILKHSNWFKGVDIKENADQDDDSQDDQYFDQEDDDQVGSDQQSDSNESSDDDLESDERQQIKNMQHAYTDNTAFSGLIRNTMQSTSNRSFSVTAQPIKKIKVNTENDQSNDDIQKKDEQQKNTKESQGKQQHFKVPQKKPSFTKNNSNENSPNKK